MTGRSESRASSTGDERTAESTGEDATDGDEEAEADHTPREPSRGESDHLEDLKDGAGCTEIWEHLSENREE